MFKDIIKELEKIKDKINLSVDKGTLLDVIGDLDREIDKLKQLDETGNKFRERKKEYGKWVSL